MSNNLTNIGLVNFAKAMIGMPYWYGTCVQRCTKDLLSSKKKQYPDHYTSAREAKYNNDISEKKVSTDCIGLIKGYAWTNGGENVIYYLMGKVTTFSRNYASNNVPDKSADGMFTYAKSLGMRYGTINTIPNIPGIAVRFKGHVGVYEGNGTVIEARGFKYGVVRTKLADRPWTDWYYIPGITYNDMSNIVYKYGDKGDGVKQFQAKLMIIRYSLPKYGADGDFGSETEAAVKAYQKNAGFAITGMVDKECFDSLNARVPEIPEDNKEVEATGGDVWVREEPNTSAKRLGVLKNGNRAKYMGADSDKGWHKVAFNNSIGWVSGKLTKIV